ncbi:MAG: BlaI/MecI/CopY family transcriptional regulator [Saprospiraceae bacterium]|nr:BlaI/MecI/CopY family transcriptional regulator [Saprospiraceae bacterium]
MQKLAKREEEIMQILWKLEKAFIKEVIEEMPEPKPHYNTVSTIVRILSDKGFVGHNTFGNTHQYFPLIQKNNYQKEAVTDILKKYFDNSYSKMVAHFAKEENISENELTEIIDMIKKKDQ